MPALIETEALSKRFGRHRGIEDVSLTVPEGEVFGFLGPNGAGKTTTIRTLLGLLRPSGGSARIFGLDAFRKGVEIRARVGNLPGDFAFDERVHGRQLVDLLCDLRGLSDRSRADELAERFHADLDRPLGELSRGNRQKIGLISALAHRPELVIMDEPTSGLDPLMQEEFARLVGELKRDGATVFLSSHDLTDVQRLCDRVGIVREGRLVAEETVDELAGRSLHRVTLTLGRPVDRAPLERLPGISDLRVDTSRASFSLSGDFDALLQAIAGWHVLDMEVTRPTLEEAFLAVYGETSGREGA